VRRSSFYAAFALLVLATAPAATQSHERGNDSGSMASEEVMTLLRSTQFEPISLPTRRGPNYIVRALDQSDREVTLTINVRSGQITAVTPAENAPRLPLSSPPGINMGEWPRMPVGAPLIVDEEGQPPRAARSRPVTPAPPPLAEEDLLPPRVLGSRPPTSTAPVPLPRAAPPARVAKPAPAPPLTEEDLLPPRLLGSRPSAPTPPVPLPRAAPPPAPAAKPAAARPRSDENEPPPRVSGSRSGTPMSIAPPPRAARPSAPATSVPQPERLSGPAVIAADPEDGGLPPPPERFPRRTPE
jgi:hypothetical protein